MTERDAFETRLRTALDRYVGSDPTEFDALDFARTVATAEPRRHGRQEFGRRHYRAVASRSAAASADPMRPGSDRGR
jgi:hypothetical protein